MTAEIASVAHDLLHTIADNGAEYQSVADAAIALGPLCGFGWRSVVADERMNSHEGRLDLIISMLQRVEYARLETQEAA